jgi:hypothetical protein
MDQPGFRVLTNGAIEFYQPAKQQIFELRSQYFRGRSRVSNRCIDILWIVADLHLPVDNVQAHFYEIHINVF